MIAFYFEALKKLTAILFFSAYLFSATGNSASFKVNELVQHPDEIKGNDATVTFLHFPNDKYNDGNKLLLSKPPLTDISNFLPAVDLFSHIQPFNPSFFEINKAVFLIINEDFVAAKRSKLVWHPAKYCGSTLALCFIHDKVNQNKKEVHFYSSILKT